MKVPMSAAQQAAQVQQHPTQGRLRQLNFESRQHFALGGHRMNFRPQRAQCTFTRKRSISIR